MLKRRIKIVEDTSPQEENTDKTLYIKKPHNHQVSEESINPNKGIDYPKRQMDIDYIKWMENNLLKDLSGIKKYEFLKVYSQNEWGELLPKEEFISNILKAFFKKDDLDIFKRNIESLVETAKKVQELEKSNKTLLKEINILKEQNRKLLSSTIDKKEIIETVLADFDSEIIELLEEEITERGSGKFIMAFTSSFKSILIVKELFEDEKDENVKLEAIHYVSSKLLKSISNLYITNRKRLLSLVAEYLSEMFENYNFISGEDFTFVDAKIHNIVFKKGQRIKESLTFCVVKKGTSQTVKYADVVTF